MNVYRGCEHGCLYCDSRSERYRIDNFSDIVVKVNAVDLLRRELARKRTRATIATGSMSDPYMPIEGKRKLTRAILAVVADYRFPLFILTKSEGIVRDIDLLKRISETFCVCAVTLTTVDDGLAGIIEPNAPSPRQRLAALRALAGAGLYCGVVMMPQLPFLQEDEKGVMELVEQAGDAGAAFILPAFGVTLRDRQREYFLHHIDHHFPGCAARYRQQFGERYRCDVINGAPLEQRFTDLCRKRNIAMTIRGFDPGYGEQVSLL